MKVDGYRDGGDGVHKLQTTLLKYILSGVIVDENDEKKEIFKSIYDSTSTSISII